MAQACCAAVISIVMAASPVSAAVFHGFWIGGAIEATFHRLGGVNHFGNALNGESVYAKKNIEKVSEEHGIKDARKVGRVRVNQRDTTYKMTRGKPKEVTTSVGRPDVSVGYSDGRTSKIEFDTDPPSRAFDHAARALDANGNAQVYLFTTPDMSGFSPEQMKVITQNYSAAKTQWEKEFFS